MSAKRSPLSLGYRLDRYELLCPIAQGGMASVWVARQVGKHGFEKLVAIKTILPEHAEDPQFRAMFLDEAHLASGIEHPNVTQILDLGEEHDVLYLVMEFVDGDSLSKLLHTLRKKKVELPLGVSLRVLAETCGGLHAAHELRDKKGALLGVVHRDVSPQNVLVSTAGHAKLIDFGIAKARDRLSGETTAGLLKGKIHYMAPEQALGKPIDRRADVWAIGAMLYHLVAGRPPIEAENQLGVLHRLASGEPPDPLPRGTPPAVEELVGRALAFEPENRIATAGEMQVALEEAMARSGVVTTAADVSRFVREHRGDHAEKRRAAIEVALSAANERNRVQESLQLDRESTSDVSVPNAAGVAAPRSQPQRQSTTGVVATAIDPTRATTGHLALRAVAIVGVAAAALVTFFMLRRPPEPEAAHPASPPPPAPHSVVVVAPSAAEPPPPPASSPSAQPAPAPQSPPPSTSKTPRPKQPAVGAPKPKLEDNDGF